MAKSKLLAITTEVGTFRYASLLQTEKFKQPDGSIKDTGKFTVQVRFTPEFTEKLKARILAEWEKFEETIEPAKRKKMKIEPNIGIKEDKDENEYFKFSMNHIIKCKDGSTFEKNVPIFDAKKNSIAKDLTSIGNGTKGRIAFEVNPFMMTATNYGCSLRLSGVQITDLVEFGGQSADAFGFDEEEGFVAEAKTGAEAFGGEVPDAENIPETDDF